MFGNTKHGICKMPWEPEQEHRSPQPEFINEALLYYAEEFKGENEFPDDIALLTLKIKDLIF